MREYEIEEEHWALKRAPQLTGKAQQAYAAMEQSQATDYEAVKTAILRRHEINDETYRQQFRSASRKDGEMGCELVVRFRDSAKKWMKDRETREDVLDILIMEQFLTTLSPETRTWVKERKPKSSTEAGQLADDYDLARRRSEGPRKGTQTGPQLADDNNPARHRSEGPRKQAEGTQTGSKRCNFCGIVGHLAHECRKAAKLRGGATGKGQPHPQPQRSEMKCYNCGQKGHLSYRCPCSAALFCRTSQEAGGWRSNQDNSVSHGGLVEGQAVTYIVLDTGCSKTLVRRDLVLEERLVDGEAVTIRCAHGDTVWYLVAKVTMEVDGTPLWVEAAVSDTLPVAVLLGTDVPELGDLLGRPVLQKTPQEGDALVVTRAQAKRQEDEARKHQQEATAEVRTTPMDSTDELTDQEGEPLGMGMEFSDDIFAVGRERRKLTRREKREARQQYRQETEEPEAVTPHVLDIPAEAASHR